jgi:hypothetical protein
VIPKRKTKRGRLRGGGWRKRKEREKKSRRRRGGREDEGLDLAKRAAVA